VKKTPTYTNLIDFSLERKDCWVRPHLLVVSVSNVTQGGDGGGDEVNGMWS